MNEVIDVRPTKARLIAAIKLAEEVARDLKRHDPRAADVGLLLAIARLMVRAREE